jgi:uncharacterized protein YecE (DUF72 family)
MAFDREQMVRRAGALADQGIYLGTSSWKYEGWLGQLYTESRYEYRGKVAKSRFDRDCLGEYAEVFPTVCVDAAYYAFPTHPFLERMANQVPDRFLFGFKVTDTITIKRYPKLDRFGPLAGTANENYLNPDLFADSFLAPCEAIRPKVGILMFEFSRFWPTDYARGREFVADLDRFLARLPSGWPYGVEIRNRNWLGPEYFECLARRRVTHVYNSWEAMPPVAEQRATPGSQTHPQLVAARFLLEPGRKYEDAVQSFLPYDRTCVVSPEAREAGAALIRDGVKSPGRRTFLFVNNRLEGNALSTLEAMVDLAGIAPGVQGNPDRMEPPEAPDAG